MSIASLPVDSATRMATTPRASGRRVHAPEGGTMSNPSVTISSVPSRRTAMPTRREVRIMTPPGSAFPPTSPTGPGCWPLSLMGANPDSTGDGAHPSRGRVRSGVLPEFDPQLDKAIEVILEELKKNPPKPLPPPAPPVRVRTGVGMAGK